ncbi:MAG: M23 family metallopeptidase [Bacteroidetes bacterium]|nr:M23 family metallopeptidase [Bacteroidota bacterium]MBU1113959.1 M23 family metallopeptidase [Bacteroidota bacterium]MBU1800104.1 M23 family metallopeptidase [Bacteroidota bacterium]
MTKIKYITFSLIIIIYSFSYAQEIEFYGNLAPGNVIIAEGNNIQWAWIDSTQLRVDSKKLFAFGFDAKETGSKILKVKHDKGLVSLKKINLPSREYKVQKINNKKQQFSTTPDSLMTRIKREREVAINAMKKIGKVDTAYYKTGFMIPIKGGVITGVFGSQRILNGVPKNMHNGLDIAVPRGTPVYAMTDGVVNLTTDNFYYAGNYIVLDHGQGLNSLYLHLSQILVKEGQHVKKGEIIGKVGTTGRSTGPHLHWGVQWYSKRVDPAELLKIKYN